MRQNLTFSIPTPCAEKWENFSMTASGGFCSSCNKTVVDLTKMSERELLRYLQHKTSNTCGRARRDQLKTYALPSFSTGMLLRAAAVSLFLMMISKPAVSQIASLNNDVVRHELNTPVVSVTIKGIVKASEDGEVVPGVSVYLKGTTAGTVTDQEGKFEFPKPLNQGDVLTFHFIGYKPVEYLVTGNETEPIIILLDTESIIMGELAITECYVVEEKGIKRFWTKVKNIF